MSTAKECPVQVRPTMKEVITPHRLTVAILIREFCKIRETTEIYRKCIRDFCILALHLIQNPDLSLDELRGSITTMYSDGSIEEDVLLRRFDGTVHNVAKIGVRFMLDIVDSIGRLMTMDNNVTPKGGIINKNSVVGYYLRRLVVNFDKLSFSEITEFYNEYKQYSGAREDQDSCRLPSADKDSVMNVYSRLGTREWSRRQAELFIATQSALLMNNEEQALSPQRLNENIRSLLRSNPDLSEAHFLSYLNYMRVREFCGAMDSLYSCFDNSTLNDPKATPEEKNKTYRYAVLNLAILHYQFGHKEEALQALQECINLAQDVFDNVCLQHCLSWLYCLTSVNRHKLVEHSILKSLDLNLSYIMSLGIQSFVHYAGITMGNPKQVFDTITKSDIINCQHSHRDLISTSYAQKSAIWLFYGKLEMSSLWSQLLLYLNTDNPTLNKTYYGEGYCQALCNVAGQLHLEGEYALSNSVLGMAKEGFPHEPSSHIWMLCDKVFQFDQLFYNERLVEAEEVAGKIAVINRWESCLRMAKLLILRRDYGEAHECINRILGRCKDGSKKFRMDVQVRAMFLLSDIQIATSFPDAVMPGVLGLLNSSLAYANDYSLQYLASMAQLRIAHVQLLMGMPAQALGILDKCLVQVLAHGGCYDRARAMLLYVKCLVADAGNKGDDERNGIILNCTKMLDKVVKQFMKVEANFRAKDALYLQAQLYNELNMVEERNHYALEYRILDEDFPTTNCHTLLTYL